MELVLNHFGCATRSDGSAVDGTASLTDVAGNDGIFYKSSPPEMTTDFSLVSCLRWCPIAIAKLVTPITKAYDSTFDIYIHGGYISTNTTGGGTTLF